MAGVALAGVLLIMRAWTIGPFSSSRVDTEDSYVRGQIVVIAPQVSGYLTEVPVVDFQQVAEGEVLARIDDRIYRARVEQAQAQVAYARAQLSNLEQALAQNIATLNAEKAQLQAYQAELHRATHDKTRMDRLGGKAVAVREQESVTAQYQLAWANVRKGEAAISIAQETIKATEVSRHSLQAQLDIALAEEKLARVDLDNTAIHAPASGQLGEASARRGQYVSAGSQLMFLVPPAVWVVANFKETQTHRLRVGMKATITVDALNGQAFSGTVDTIAPATGSEFSLLRPDNATGNFTKIVQRLPVKIVIDPAQPLFERLRPGMSVVTSIDTAQTMP